MSDSINNDKIINGRKKVFLATQKLELLLPNGKSDGFLEKDDAVYVVKRVKIKGVSYLKFRVIKFANSKKEPQVYTAERKYFKRYVETKSNIDGDSSDTNSAIAPSKVNYKVPTITALSGGVLGYLLAKKYDKNLLVFGFGGVVIGALVGVFITKYKTK
jgi:hypothetical protein